MKTENSITPAEQGRYILLINKNFTSYHLPIIGWMGEVYGPSPVTPEGVVKMTGHNDPEIFDCQEDNLVANNCWWTFNYMSEAQKIALFTTIAIYRAKVEHKAAKEWMEKNDPEAAIA